MLAVHCSETAQYATAVVPWSKQHLLTASGGSMSAPGYRQGLAKRRKSAPGRRHQANARDRHSDVALYPEQKRELAEAARGRGGVDVLKYREHIQGTAAHPCPATGIRRGRTGHP